MAEDKQRIVLLNTLLSRSTTRAKAYDAPIHDALELLKIIEKRRSNKFAIEFYEADDDPDDTKRIALGHSHDFVRLRHTRFEESAEFTYVTLLVEFVDWSKRSFPVVNTDTYAGREIEGEDNERGSTTAHVVARIPKQGALDLGKYRCAIEVVHPITRRDIEHLLCKQLRRHSTADAWTFSVQVKKAKGRDETKEYRYTPRLELAADVGRKLNLAIEGDGEISLMVFTKRREKQSIGQASAVVHDDFLADIEYRVGANQGPPDPDDKISWAQKIQDNFRLRGFDTHLYFRHPNGAMISGEIHKAIAGAADLLMCPREHISLSKPPKSWVSTINAEIVTQMRALLDRDELWEHSQ